MKNPKMFLWAYHNALLASFLIGAVVEHSVLVGRNSEMPIYLHVIFIILILSMILYLFCKDK